MDFQPLRVTLALLFIWISFGSQKGLLGSVPKSGESVIGGARGDFKSRAAVQSRVNPRPGINLKHPPDANSSGLFGNFGTLGGGAEGVSHPSLDQAWKRFQLDFGQDLQAEWTPDGHLVSVKGASGTGMVSPDFDPKDSRSAIERASEVVRAAGPLLEIDPEWPLGNAAARSGEVSAQVFFQQTYNDVPLAPVGSVKVDLGKRGEVLAVYSNYAPHVRIVNQLRMDSAEARSHVQETGQIEGGGKVIWVSGVIGGIAQGRYAYQFSVRGHHIVIDGETGATLVHRDLREY